MTQRLFFQQLTAELTPLYGGSEAHSIARIVFEDALHVRTLGDALLDSEQIALLQSIAVRLVAGEPVQYVLGEADFFGLKYTVNPAVLIPRQETEELVAWGLKWLKERGLKTPDVIDIGAGSGCIGLALLVKIPGLRLWSIDKSREALEVARLNAARLAPNAAVYFAEMDILDEAQWSALPMFDLIVSNPPYIPLQERALMPPHVLDHEPALALFVSDADPLVFYRKIAIFARQKLRSGGAVLFECNEFNATDVADLLGVMQFSGVFLQKDLSGADRMAMGII